MKLALVRHLWGVDLRFGLSHYAKPWRDVGYEAVETSIRMVPDKASFLRFLSEENFKWVAVVYTDMFETNGSMQRHLESLREQLEECAEANPIKIIAHSGLDRWSFCEMEDFFGGSLELEAKFGIPLCHETHRRRCLATPWAAEAILTRYPVLKLNADLSHWVCVTERLLHDFESLIDRVAKQTHHIHARVGHEHGPQVPDPRSPEWEPQLLAHESWWKRIWRSQRERGIHTSTVTPEFGPPPYQTTLPFTRAPLNDLAEVCDWMAQRLKKEF